VLGHIVEKWQLAGVFYKNSGAPTSFSNSSGNTFNNGGATSVQLGELPTGSVYKSGNNMAYFTGLTQVQDPSVKNMPANLQAQSALLALQDASGNIIVQNPTPGSLGTLSPTSWRGLGTFTFNMQASKFVTLNRERNITMNFRADAINLLNHPIWGTPNLNIDSTSFGLITSSGGTRSVNLTLRVTF
jgi:hypothetical protein